MFEEMEAEMRDEDDPTVNENVENAPEDSPTCQKWSRPPLKSIDPKNDAITFQQLDVDYYRVRYRFTQFTLM